MLKQQDVQYTNMRLTVDSAALTAEMFLSHIENIKLLSLMSMSHLGSFVFTVTPYFMHNFPAVN